MKTIGLIGGMSWESSLEYYRIINETVKERLGGFHSARCVMYSVDFAEIEAYQRSGRWDEAGRALAAAAQAVERAGAGLLVLCTNTMHKVAPDIQAAIRIPFLHIADATGQKIADAGFRRVGLLGTRSTMEHDFYRLRLQRRFDLEVLVPGEPDRTLIDRIIYDELVLGQIRDESRAAYMSCIERFVEAGTEGIILGCTEIGLLVGQSDSPVPLFDTARIHAVAAAEYALSRSLA